MKNADAPLLAPPPEPPRFHGARCTAYACLALLAAAGVAWVAARAERVAAPLVVFPVALGLVLGGLLSLAAWLCRAPHYRAAVGIAVFAGLLTAVAHHAWSYREAKVRARHMQIMVEAEAARQAGPKGQAAVLGVGELLVEQPKNLWEFLQSEARRGRPLWGWRARGVWAWLWWGIDALLVAAAAGWGVSRFATLPFCDRCGSWYRTVRAGQLAPAAQAGIVARLGLDPMGFAGSARVRIMSCMGGCGPLLLIVACAPSRRVWRVWVSQAAAEQVAGALNLRS